MVTSLKWTSISSADLEKAKFRMEAAVYKIEARAAHEKVKKSSLGSVKLWSDKGLVSNAFYPGRFKRIYVSKENGFPMILPSQMISIQPKATKYISQKNNYDVLKLIPNTLLITRSGTIGNCTIVTKTLAGQTMSDDVIRVSFIKEFDLGYTYAYLRTEIGQLILSTSQYGSVIQHIEPEHLKDVDIPITEEVIKKSIHEKIIHSFNLRDSSNELIDLAEDILITELNLPEINQIKPRYYDNKSDVQNYSITLDLLDNRFDGSYHLPLVDSIIDLLLDNAEKVLSLNNESLTSKIFLPGRFKRTYVEKNEGKVFFGGKQIYEIDPSGKKYLSLKLHGNRIAKELLLHENMILVTRSGTIGRVNIVPQHFENWVANEHILRVIPKDSKTAGYLYIWLNSEYGRILINRFTYGSVVDEIDETHLSKVPVPILKNKGAMKKINDLALEANKLRSEAYYLEQEAIDEMNEKVIFAS